MRGPFAIVTFDWPGGELQLRFVGSSIDGKPAPKCPMRKIQDAARWSSRQAAGQYLARMIGKQILTGAWHVQDLRQLAAPWRWPAGEVSGLGPTKIPLDVPIAS